MRASVQASARAQAPSRAACALTHHPRPPLPPTEYDNSTLLKLGCLSANVVTEEAIDVVLNASYPDAANVWKGYKLLK